ncbi:MAG: hypothetical protein AB1609_22070 [Bacillota bacterium]
MWKTTCPRCGAEDELFIVAGNFSGRIPLCSDGFSFLDAKHLNTEDEIVRCDACGAEFPLGDLDDGA